MTAAPLKLRAGDSEDLDVIGAVLQDAIAPVCDMTYRPEEQRFILIVQRFMWDEALRAAARQGPDKPVFERVRCAIDISGVTGVQYQGFDPHAGDGAQILSLLTMGLESGTMALVFAGGAMLRLKLEGWSLLLEDFGDPWPTPNQPCHAC